LRGGPQPGGFRGVAGRQGGLDRHALEDVEGQVHLDGAVPVVHPQGPGHLGQGGQRRAIDGGEAARRFGFPAPNPRQGLVGQGADEFARQGGIEDAAGFARRTEGGPFAAQAFLDLGQAAALLDAPQAVHQGAEEGRQEEAGERVKMELAVAGAIALGGIGVETVQ